MHRLATCSPKSTNQSSDRWRQRRPAEVVLRGSTENQNIGDRLMWAATSALLRDMGVITTYRFTHWDRRFDAVPRPNRVDALLDLGNVYYCDSWPQPLRDRMRRCLRFNRTFRNAALVYLPCGWGPYHREDWPQLKELTRRAIVFARDPISLGYINEALDSDQATLCPDLAFMCQSADMTVGAELLQHLGFSLREPILGLIPNARCVEEGVTPLRDPSIYHRHLRQAVTWAHTNGYQVVGISHMVDTDRDRKLLVGLDVPIVESNDPTTVRSIIANLSLAVCSRYHSLVNCLVHGVPAVSLGWQHKYRGLMEHFRLSELDHPLEQRSEQLSDRLGHLSRSRNRISHEIREKVQQARATIHTEMSRLSRHLGGPAEVFKEPVPFESDEIRTVSHVRLAPGPRVLRFIRSLASL